MLVFTLYSDTDMEEEDGIALVSHISYCVYALDTFVKVYELDIALNKV